MREYEAGRTGKLRREKDLITWTVASPTLGATAADPGLSSLRVVELIKFWSVC